MKRSVRLVTLAVSLVLAPFVIDAQPRVKAPRIGWLSHGSTESHGAFFEAFRGGLRELGYVEGQTVTIESRWAEGRLERLPELAADLVQLKPNVLVTSGSPAIRATKHATTTIPIVMALSADPVGSGFVTSLARPGGNITGLASEDLIPKLLELLHAAVPRASRVAVLVNPTNPAHAAFWRESQVGAQTLGVKLLSVEVRGLTEFESAFATMTRERVGGLTVLPDSLFLSQRARLVELAAKNRLPTMYAFREFTDAGGLMSYGVNLRDAYRRAATYVDKILKGAKPADLPVEQPTTFDLVINLKTAKALGLAIPQPLLLRAAEVIQ